MKPLTSIRKTLFALVAILSMLQVETLAHGDLHARIAELSNQIEQNPDSTYLFMKRGILFFQHEEYEKALNDLKECSKRNYEDRLLDLTFSKTYHKLGKYNLALEHLNKLIANDPGYVHAYRMKGLVLFDKGHFEESAAAFVIVTQKAIQRLPSNYLDASLSFEKIGTPAGNKAAIDIVYAGIDDLGEIFTFNQRLVELGLKFNNYDLAINHQTKIIETSNRKEKPYFERAKIYLESGDEEEAERNIQLAREAMKNLPSRIQHTKAMIALSEQIEQLLNP